MADFAKTKKTSIASDTCRKNGEVKTKNGAFVNQKPCLSTCLPVVEPDIFVECDPWANTTCTNHQVKAHDIDDVWKHWNSRDVNASPVSTIASGGIVAPTLIAPIIGVAHASVDAPAVVVVPADGADVASVAVVIPTVTSSHALLAKGKSEKQEEPVQFAAYKFSVMIPRWGKRERFVKLKRTSTPLTLIAKSTRWIPPKFS